MRVAEADHFTYIGEQVWDARILQHGSPMSYGTKEEYAPLSEQLLFDFAHDNWKYRPKQAMRVSGYVCGLTLLRSAGYDGEDYSGCIELVRVDRQGQESFAGLTSWQAHHDTGLPAEDSSWACEFSDIDLATQFWDKYRPGFLYHQTLEKLADFTNDNAQAKESAIDIYQLGTLLPWFKERVADRAVRVGNFLLQERHFTQASSELSTGKVFKLPVQNFGDGEEEFGAATCVGSRTVQCRRGAFTYQGKEPVTVVQWDDGTMGHYRESDSLPHPLTKSDIKLKSAV